MSDPVVRARALLAAVAELHTRGYHGLRIRPGMNSSGGAWRCELLVNDRRLLRYGSASGERLTSTLTLDGEPRQLATDLEAAYAPLLAQARTQDAPYVAWFAAMLAATGPGSVPISYSDYDEYDTHWGMSPEAGTIPLPPAPPAPPRPRPL